MKRCLQIVTLLPILLCVGKLSAQHGELQLEEFRKLARIETRLDQAFLAMYDLDFRKADSDLDRFIDASARSQERIQKEVRHELVMLPYLGVFDNVAYKVDGHEVTLMGQVTRPVLKSDAGYIVKRIEGVERVNNQIEVLPLSAFDDRLRLRLFRAIYSYAPLQKYALGVNKPIRIIVKQGHVDLQGMVDNQADKNIAGIRANGVSDIFSVSNNLKIAN
jgi:hyperosmotically inducible periplasmic protein